MIDYREIVTGRIVSRAGEPVGSAVVEVYDKDLIVNDHLGTAKTSADGTFRVQFRWSDFRENGFEGRPDIFVKVKSPSGKTTKSQVFQELKGTLTKDDSEELMNIGDIAVDA